MVMQILFTHIKLCFYVLRQGRTQDIFSGGATGKNFFLALIFISPENTFLYAKEQHIILELV